MSQRGMWTRIVQAPRAVGLLRVGLGGLAALLLLAFGAAVASAETPPLVDMSGGAYQILAPGEEGGLNYGKQATDQGKLYNKLTPKEGKVTQETVKRTISARSSESRRVLAPQKPRARP